MLWLDVDEYQPDIIDQLLARDKDILTPRCVLEYGGRRFDRNAWRDRGVLHLEDLRDAGEVVPLRPGFLRLAAHERIHPVRRLCMGLARYDGEHG